MVMPLCGTFHYAGVVPELKAVLAGDRWPLDDRSGAETVLAGGFDRLRDHRLLGLHPFVRISGIQLVLESARRHRAEVRSASLDLDRSLLEALHAGDRLELVRTGTGDIGLSALRAGELLWAAGAVTAVPLGPALQVQSGPAAHAESGNWPREDTWLEVSIDGESSRLRDGEESTLGGYRVSVVRTFRDGMPGQYENAAISRDDAGVHDAVVRGAGRLALTLTAW